MTASAPETSMARKKSQANSEMVGSEREEERSARVGAKRLKKSSQLTSNEPGHGSQVEEHVDEGNEEDDGGEN